MRVKQKLFLFLLLFTSALTFTLFSCSNPTDPRLQSSLSLTVEGVTSTEAFIKLSTNNVSLPANVTLSRNKKQINSFTLITADTTIVDNNLNPNQSYTYRASLQSSSLAAVQSEAVMATTMDTTSHNFTFETFTFGGQGGSSTLYDVAIIAENDIWAVGQMYVYDSTGSPILYNAVHWDGSRWELKRIKYFGQCSAVVYPSLRAIIAFSKNDIILTNGGSIGFFDGTKIVLDCGVNPLLNGAIKKIWGISSKDFYVVGDKGSIAHYNNGSWQKIESGTELNINDIYGAKDPETGKLQILSIASNGFTKKLLELQGSSVIILSDSGLANDVDGIWFVPNKGYYVVGAGIHYKHLLNDNVWSHYPPGVVTSYLSGGVRGSDINNVFVTGSFFEIVHFNGVSWHNYRDVIPFNSNGAVGRLDVKGNLFITVGRSGAYAVAIMGKQN